MITLSNIQTITEQCCHILTDTDALRGTELAGEAYSKAKELYTPLRKLFIASMMHNKQLICISGLQGAGKTTLMKNFYGIKEDLMNIAQGRGERVPVLISEDDIQETQIKAIAVKRDETGCYSKSELFLKDREEIIRATKGEDQSIMYVEITVPYKHLQNNGVSFLLLPGFEKNNEYWNNLIDFSVKSSDAAVFVFDETSFSNVENEDYLNRIEKHFGNNVVYAITGADRSIDDNAETKKTCMECLKVGESDRIICVGQYGPKDESKNKAWIESFKQAIEKYVLVDPNVSKKKDEFISDEIEKIEDILYGIREHLDNFQDLDSTEYDNHRLLKEYDRIISKKRELLNINITAEFEKAKKSSIDNLASIVSSQPKIKELKRILFGISVKEQYITSQNNIKASLCFNGKNSLADEYLGKAISDTIRSIDTPQDSTPNTLQLLVDVNTNQGLTFLSENEDNKSLINDICALLQKPIKNNALPRISSDQNSLFKAIGEVICYYYGWKCHGFLKDHTGSLLPYEPTGSKLRTKDVLQGAEESKKFAVGLAGVMGVDILTDGSLNLISQIASTCSVAVPVAGIAATLFVGSGMTTTIIKDINGMQRADFESGKMTISTIYDNIKHEALNSFDAYSNQVRDRIEGNLRVVGGNNDTSVNIYNAKVDINNLFKVLKDIKEDNNRHASIF